MTLQHFIIIFGAVQVRPPCSSRNAQKVLMCCHSAEKGASSFS